MVVSVIYNLFLFKFLVAFLKKAEREAKQTQDSTEKGEPEP